MLAGVDAPIFITSEAGRYFGLPRGDEAKAVASHFGNATPAGGSDWLSSRARVVPTGMQSA